MGNLAGSSRGMSSLAMILFILAVPILLLIVMAMPTSVPAGLRNTILVAITGLAGLVGVLGGLSVLKR